MAAADVDISSRPTRRGTRLTPRVEGWVTPDGRHAVYPTAGAELARTTAKLGYHVDKQIWNVEWGNYYGDCDGKPIDKYHARAVGFAMSRILRHNPSLQVNYMGLRLAGQPDFGHGMR